MPHLIREQRIRQRLNWFRKAQEFGSVADAYGFFGILRKTDDTWCRRYAISAWDRPSVYPTVPGVRPHPFTLACEAAACGVGGRRCCPCLTDYNI